MTNMVRWDPFADLRTTMDRLFDEGFSRPWRFLPVQEQQEWAFPIEMSESEHEIDVKAALPGVKPEEVEISVTNDVLTIRAEHREESEDKKKDYYRREIRYGTYHRSLALPVAVETEKADARFENGVLFLKLPKAEAVRPKQIKLTGDGKTAIEAGR
jgi:HSP20 family protein